MKLTGKCKNDFIEFLLNTDCKYSLNIEEGQLVSDAFFECHLSMQYGVYVDFFDSVGLRIGVSPVFENDFWVYLNNEEINDIDFKTRPEARTAAIKKANEIYNAQ